MTQIVSALAPIFLLIFVGLALRKGQLVPAEFWRAAERVTYFVFFPALLVSNTAVAGFGGIQVAPMAVVLVGGVLASSGVMLVARRRMTIDGPQFTSLFQGSIRPNTYVAIAAAVALFGEAGLTLIALAIVIVVPTVNVLSVAVLARYASADAAPLSFSAAMGLILRNPLIIACLVGATLNAGGVAMPPVIGPTLEILGRAALPVGLLAVGAGLNISVARSSGLLVSFSVLCKLVVVPLVTFALCTLLGVSGFTATVCVLYASLPTSPSSFVLAREMGGDTELMAAIITVSTLAAMIVMPLALYLVR